MLPLILKTAVWTAFYCSLFGMLACTILRSRSTREMLINLWVKSTSHLEGEAAVAAVKLTRQFVFALYTKDGIKISLKKVSLLSFLGAMVWAAYVLYSFVDLERLARFSTPVPVILVVANIACALLLFPSHLLIELLLARFITGAARRASDSNPLKLALMIGSGVLAYYLLPVAVMTFFTLAFNLESESYKLLSAIAIFALGPAALPIFTTFGLSSLRRTSLLLGALAFLVSYSAALLLVALASALANSRFLLRLTSLLLEKLTVETSNRAFNGCLLVFSLSTGLMQAWTF
jgi:hypothetical protein